MKAVLDINILLDLLLKREPHRHEAARLFQRIEEGRVDGYICATSVDTLHYIMTKEAGRQRSRELLTTILRLLSVLPVDGQVVMSALQLDWKDLEDAIIHEAARLGGMDVVVTRDGDFTGGSFPALTAGELLVHI